MSFEQPKGRSPLTARRLLLTPTRFAPDGGLALANFVRSFELNSNITPRRRLLCSLGLKAQGLPRSTPGTPHLRLTGNTGISRLARSTKLSKTESRFRLSGAFSVRLES